MASKANISDWPFPHLLIENALDDALYEQLAHEFPGPEVLLDGKEIASNKSYHYNTSKILADSRISPLWREFMACHVSPRFYAEVFDLNVYPVTEYIPSSQ